jgi:hypothetical protein
MGGTSSDSIRRSVVSLPYRDCILLIAVARVLVFRGKPATQGNASVYPTRIDPGALVDTEEGVWFDTIDHREWIESSHGGIRMERGKE